MTEAKPPKPGENPRDLITFQQYENLTRPAPPPDNPRKRMESDIYRVFKPVDRRRWKNHVEKTLRLRFRKRVNNGERIFYDGRRFRKPEKIPANVIRLPAKRWERLVRIAHMTYPY